MDRLDCFLLVLLGLLAVAHSQDKPSIADKIDSIFGNLDVQAKNPNVTTPTPDDCVCVPYYLCKDDSTIDPSGAGIIDIRVQECDHYMKKCCLPPVISKVPITPAPIVRQGCGKRNAKGVAFRITGDEDNEAQFGEFPWMVAVTQKQIINGNSDANPDNLVVYQCGATLIHPQAVITAAHCVADKANNYMVRAGEWDTQTSKEILPHQDRAVKSVTIHPEYYSGALYNDIAVLILESPFELAEHIDVACLPPQGFVVPGGTRCFATGWGKDVFGKEGVYQVILKKVDLPIVERHTCQDNLRKTRLGKYFELHESFVCAGGELGKDTCKGDGGSPLVCPISAKEDRYQQVGIVSWGISCGEKDTPGVYANVALFINWIEEQMKQNNIDLSLYQ